MNFEQHSLFEEVELHKQVVPFKSQLLKWIGNKQRQASDIIRFFPQNYNTYYEPFLGGGGVLGVLAPSRAVASDVFEPLVQIWNKLATDPEGLKQWYKERHDLLYSMGDKKTAYEFVKMRYNTGPNGADLLFLCRVCYGGVVRFRKADGYMSTPCGPHTPMKPNDFNKRVDEWYERTKNTTFLHADFSQTMDMAGQGDLIYLDPPYVDSQAILYGAQSFSIARMFESIEKAKSRGAYVALSIDGTKFSGKRLCEVPVPENLFAREVFVDVGRSMLKRFQMEGKSLEEHVVKDRLLLTY